MIREQLVKHRQLLEHTNEVLKQWITDPEVHDLVFQMEDVLKKLYNTISSMPENTSDDNKVFVIRVENNNYEEVEALLSDVGCEVDLLEVYEN